MKQKTTLLKQEKFIMKIKIKFIFLICIFSFSIIQGQNDWNKLDINWKKNLSFQALGKVSINPTPEEIEQIKNIDTLIITSKSYDINNLEGIQFISNVKYLSIKNQQLSSLKGSKYIKNIKQIIFQNELQLSLDSLYNWKIVKQGAFKFKQREISPERKRLWWLNQSTETQNIISQIIGFDENDINDYPEILNELFTTTSIKLEYSIPNKTANDKNLEFLRFLENLITVKIKNANIKNLNIISNLKKIKVLGCIKSNLRSIEGIEKLKYLEVIDLSYNKIKSLSRLKELKNLEVLICEKNSVEDISFIKHITKLKTLMLGHNRIVSLKGINKLNEHEYIGVQPGEVNHLYSSYLKDYQEKLVVFSPITFLNKDGFRTHKLLRCIDLNIVISKLEPTMYAKSSEIIYTEAVLLHAFQQYPQIIENTRHILDSCSIDMTNDYNHNRITFTGIFGHKICRNTYSCSFSSNCFS